MILNFTWHVIGTSCCKLIRSMYYLIKLKRTGLFTLQQFILRTPFFLIKFYMINAPIISFTIKDILTVKKLLYTSILMHPWNIVMLKYFKSQYQAHYLEKFNYRTLTKSFSNSIKIFHFVHIRGTYMIQLSNRTVKIAYLLFRSLGKI